jgi:predicted porin
MRANFNIEMGINTTDSGMIANASNRNSFVGLSDSKLGEVRLGRFATLNKLINDSTVFGGGSFTTVGVPTSGWGWAAQANGSGVSNERINNALHYISPTFSGANVQLQFVDDKNDVNTADAPETKVRGYFVGVNYAAGKVAVRYARKDVLSETAAVAAAALDPTALLLVDPVFGRVGTVGAAQMTGIVAGEETRVTQDSALASYNFGFASITATYNNTTTTPLTAAGRLQRSDITVGASVPLGNTTLLAQYSQGTQSAVNAQDDKVTGYQLGAVYNLSKRSNIYAAYGSGATKDGDTNREGTDRVMALGVRHTF